ncbi:FtsX-like permease family protein [Clostridium sp. CF011]|uniref:FtsX-like permease family protein n=1 Tax=unclassified Clostridium TaxID=2614128 RepID=UPI001C0DAB8A|nr:MULTISPECIES: FtsX-like permease family protein [unclassified Clostridium]MBU3091219.1 FtsX-like permease family protein [Clostridium sp. CF011]MBW9146495.1 FtsX-like permease family protein [Clostridium sp. CM027]UVE39622.1 FtsX-like permease family protein [Clostridium sp. CM027]WAG68529.1 FtsX-like permease family protein [Clostridium sp. CF011]
MFFKLVFKNVRRSIKDYVVYFLTLALAVSLFYAFNSIASQPGLSKLSSAMKMMTDTMNQYIGILSKFIAVILAFVVVYANQFIMKRRKKEMGMYMTLGMDKWSISSIFVGEIVLVGIFSLIVGLGIGLLLSQGLSLIALNLFATDVSSFQLVLSVNAIKETIINFAIIFGVVMIVNTRSIFKLKLIDLLTADRKNQELRVHNKWISFLLFATSVFCMILGIYILFSTGLSKTTLPKVMVLIGVGILLFYYTASSVMILFVQKNKRMYFHGLNTFLFRQIGSKLQTNYLVITVISGLLLCSLVVLSSGFSISGQINNLMKKSIPYDVTVLLPISKDKVTPLEKSQKDGVILQENLKDYCESILYVTDYTYGDIFEGQVVKLSITDKDMPESKINFMSETEFNKQMTLQNEKRISLSKNQYLINATYKNTIPYVDHFLKNHGKIKVAGQELTPQRAEPLNKTIIAFAPIGANDPGTIIVPDEIVSKLIPETYFLNGLYKADANKELLNAQMIKAWSDSIVGGSITYTTKDVLQDFYFGTFGVVAFICSYFGLVLIIICLAVLALQQLTETQDNKERYHTLANMGADGKMIRSTLFLQIGFYFIVPLIMSMVLSMFITRSVLNEVESFFQMSIGLNMGVSFAIIIVLYIMYFIATYESAKQIIVEQKIK